MKSQVTSSTSILRSIYIDVCRRCDVVFDSRDIDTLMSRTKHEGLQFLTVTLPTLGADFERALEIGKVDPTMFRSFKKRGSIPRLFGVVLDRVFSESGLLLDEPSPKAIQGIRQLSYTFKKPKEACSEDKITTAFNRFIEVEQELAAFRINETDWSCYARTCSLVWDNIIAGLNCSAGIPKHGPGATAERYTPNRKYELTRWHHRLENFFPSDAYTLPSVNFVDSVNWKKLQLVSPEKEQPVRVIAVPKTATKPRIIAIEPCCMQYTQQGLARLLVETLEKVDGIRGHINFTDQTINRRLAMASSIDRRKATLDLSDASDRVLNDLVAPIFRANEDFYLAIQACRSMSAQLKMAGKKHIQPLVKFASMGSALCFPIEAMVFYTICVLGHIRGRKEEICHKSVINAQKQIYVYGDDLIVPANTASVVRQTLELFGLKVNGNKSFVRGFFRESCGLDAYKGEDVTPVYMRYQPNGELSDPKSFISLVESANQFAQKGYWSTFYRIKALCERQVKLPYIGSKCQALGWKTPDFRIPTNTHEDFLLTKDFSEARWNKEYQCTEYRMLVPKVAKRRDRIGGTSILLRWMLQAEYRGPSPERKFWVPAVRVLPEPPLKGRSERRGTVALRYRWTRPY